MITNAIMCSYKCEQGNDYIDNVIFGIQGGG